MNEYVTIRILRPSPKGFWRCQVVDAWGDVIFDEGGYTAEEWAREAAAAYCAEYGLNGDHVVIEDSSSASGNW